jgi:hypothetical protein
MLWKKEKMKMKTELSDKFYDRWPGWFQVSESDEWNLRFSGFECEDGWFDLLWNLCEKIEPFAPEDFRVQQIKESFGSLRFYASHYGVQEVYEQIQVAEAKSEVICEVCGKDGKLRGGLWLRTLCDEHEAARK